MPKAAVTALIIVAALAAVVMVMWGGGGAPDANGGLGPPAGGTSTTARPGEGDPIPLEPAVAAGPSSAVTTRPAPGGRPGATAGTGTASNGQAGAHQVAQHERVRGVVRTPGGLAAAGAQVMLTVRGADGPKLVSGRTDADGRFELTAPVAGEASVQVQAPGLATVAVPVTSGETLQVEPPPAVEITGLVRDGQGAPLPGAFVTADEVGAALVPARTIAQSGPDGTFRLGALRRDARYRLQATHPTLAPSEPLEVLAPAVDATLTLFEGATLVVKVFDADGAVLSNGPLKKTQSGWQSLRSFAEVHGPRGSRTLSNWNVTNPEQFEITGLSPGQYRVVLQVRGHGRVERDGIAVPRGGTVDTELRLTRGGFVRVTVVDDEGRPLVSATATDAAIAGTPFGMLVQGLTGTEGIARVGPLPGGATRIRVWAAGYQTGFADVDMQPGLELSARVTLKRP